MHTWKEFYILDIDDCAGQNCSSNGNCIDLVDGYECNCTVGFTGIQCETGWHFTIFVTTFAMFVFKL